MVVKQQISVINRILADNHNESCNETTVDDMDDDFNLKEQA